MLKLNFKKNIIRGKCLWMFLFLLPASRLYSQESFIVRNFDILVEVNQNASLNITEKISVFFTRPMHGIIRSIPYRYKMSELPSGTEKAQMAWVSRDFRYTKISDIKVTDKKFETGHVGNYATIKIGSKDKLVSGDQEYQLSYQVDGDINFFKDFSELYLNLTGNEWNTTIEKVHFMLHFYAPVPDTARWFVASGRAGSRENNTTTRWNQNHTILEGKSIAPLSPYEGITVGVSMPENFLVMPNYRNRGLAWVVVPVLVFVLMLGVWKKWGKDLPVTLITAYYPPEGISPSVAGYVIDGKLDRRDLTALIPYWGAGGYLQVKDTEKKEMLGLIKNHEYEFIKLKDLPDTVETFEKTMFRGLFNSRNSVKLDELKNSFFKTMNQAKTELNAEIDSRKYYTKYSRSMAVLLPLAGAILLIFFVIGFVSSYPVDLWRWLSLCIAAVILIIFGSLMSKKTIAGTDLYQKLLGFKEFIKTVERDKLEVFLKQDPDYFDKVLPFAIVFNVADKWKDKLKGLDVPPPTWYSSNYGGSNFNTLLFLNSLDHSMNAMSQTFYSMPSSSGSSGGSFGGGGFSGGGFGGGGGGGW